MDYFEARANLIMSEMQKLDKLSHKLSRGQHFESIAKNLLEESLPSQYGIDTGFIESAENTTQSSQQDLIIFDRLRGVPIKTYGSFKVYPSESVYAVIEVKTRIDENSLINTKNNVIKHIEELKNLPKSSTMPLYFGSSARLGWNTSNTLGMVFALEGTSLNSLKTKLDDYYKKNKNTEMKKPDLICILKQGYIITQTELTNRLRLQISGNDLKDLRVSLGTPGSTLRGFIFLLVTLLNGSQLLPVNLLNYAE
ncbi:MAG: hypothetical protein A2Y57_03190 [Candidatus Woykebacteria bacterium RBG_13_40_7b]|uniref:DUF6602 domain-containing protein n=1 Tax=Candidatus Woykebacteria bacterium RBG_13_40_7b TaxID=1802594 RepID=A0A1G1W698_9BACT|nr:MAG: hypothetical protein A2Y57_03190 [Candidatus Woykebacteria bacterium RBG_13_40_7b]